jgi:quercetin dioxygenase-like cupin family protein
MKRGKSLYDFPIHLGIGARAVAEPQFTGFDWYEGYGERHAGDLDEGRLVSMFRFEESWTSWEMHPVGEEVVCCLQGHMTLHQELADGGKESWELGPGEYAINPRGAWHTADAAEPVVALFITAGKGTMNRPR